MSTANSATPKTDARISFENAIAALRHDILQTERRIQSLKAHEFFGEQSQNPTDGVDVGEAKANITIAYRHAEDARMRLGKVFQAIDGGVSPLQR